MQLSIVLLQKIKNITLKRFSFLCILVMVNLACQAQFYYKDVISNKLLQNEMLTYKNNKVRSVLITSYEDNGEKSEGFFCSKKITKDYKKTTLFTRADVSPAALLVSVFDADGRLLQTTDSSQIIVKHIQYTYNDAKKITTIKSTLRSKDEDFDNSITEEHLYTYTKNVLSQMQLIKNEKDTTLILFFTDEQGNVTLEKNAKSGQKYYYYYDAKGLLTDIVPAFNNEQRLKPDYIFVYDNAGLIKQMTAVEEGSNNYFVWKYSYENGLRTTEKCYTNERKLMGSIAYEYK